MSPVGLMRYPVLRDGLDFWTLVYALRMRKRSIEESEHDLYALRTSMSQGSNPGPSPLLQGFVNSEQPFQAQPHGSRGMMQISAVRLRKDSQ